MNSTWRLLSLAGLMAMAGLHGATPDEARAQIPVYSTEKQGPRPRSGPCTAPHGPITVTLRSRGHDPDRPTVVPGRPVYQTQRLYYALRPNYEFRPQLSFAPYSDSYPKSAPAVPNPFPTYYRLRSR